MGKIKKILSLFIPRSYFGKLSWLAKFFVYSLRMLFVSPKRFIEIFPRAVAYNFFPNRVRNNFRLRIIQANQIDEAIRVFKRDGFVVIANALSPEEVAGLKQTVYKKADEMLALDKAGQLPAGCKHGNLRYSYGDYQHQSSWEYLAFNKRILPILERIWSDEEFSAALVGGDFVLPGGTYQPIHSDCGWGAAGRNPQMLIVNYYVIDVAKENGPIRQVPGTQFFPIPSPWFLASEPQWMKECLVTAPAGTAIIRDPRAWHGGTPNVSSIVRSMPNCEFVCNNIPLSYLGEGLIKQRLIAGSFVQRFNHADKKAA